MEFYLLVCIKIDLTGLTVVGSFEDNLYTGMLKDSSKYLTETKNIGNRGEIIFLDFWVTTWIYDVSCYFLFRFFDHPIWVVACKKYSMEVVHFFSQDF